MSGGGMNDPGPLYRDLPYVVVIKPLPEWVHTVLHYGLPTMGALAALTTLIAIFHRKVL